MKKATKLFRMLLTTAFLLIVLSVPAYAACTCGGSSKTHSSTNHSQKKYLSNGAGGHKVICLQCVNNGHSETCAEAVISSNESHVMSYTGSGASRTGKCSHCDYTAACAHSNAKWTEHYNTVGGTGTTQSLCVKYCSDCKNVVDTKSHNWTYQRYDSKDKRFLTQHKTYCRDCGYTSQDDKLKTHTWRYVKYNKPAVPSNPITNVTSSSSAAQAHTANVTCTGCGFSTLIVEQHTFNKNVCTKCKMDKGVTTAVSSLKGKKKGKVKHQVITVRSRYIWNGNSWVFYKSRKVHSYTYKMKISWKKNKNAYGYYVSIGKPTELKTGSYITSTYASNTSIGSAFTKKTSATLSLEAAKKLKKTTVYVAPISKYGYVGKYKKVTVKLR